MQDAILHLYTHRLFINGKFYSFSGGAMSHPLVRRRLIDDNSAIPLGRCCEGGNNQLRVSLDLLEQIEQAIAELVSKGRLVDRHLHNRTLFVLNTDRLDEINGQLQCQEPHFSAREDHTGQSNLDSSENKGRPPDFNWDQF